MEMAPNEVINHGRGLVCIPREHAVIYSHDITCNWLRKFGFKVIVGPRPFDALSSTGQHFRSQFVKLNKNRDLFSY